ncbi:hypothetical protein BDV19DRAFT_385469 [Aspergillus venezuelensis]
MVTWSLYGSIYFAGLLHQARIRRLENFHRLAEPIHKRSLPRLACLQSQNELPSPTTSRPLLGKRESQPLPAYRRYMSSKSRPANISPNVNTVPDPEGILNDAAITLSRLLDASNAPSGLFGRYAMGILHMARPTLDIDCIAGCSKNQIIGLVDRTGKFKVVSQDRSDYAIFKWSDHKERNHRIIGEVFCEKFPGAMISTIWSGWGDFYHLYIQNRSNELNLEQVGQALKRYPTLDLLFRLVDVGVDAAKDAAHHLSLPPVAVQVAGEVQAAILG